LRTSKKYQGRLIRGGDDDRIRANAPLSFANLRSEMRSRAKMKRAFNFARCGGPTLVRQLFAHAPTNVSVGGAYNKGLIGITRHSLARVRLNQETY
jgi:hypothetical protein